MKPMYHLVLIFSFGLGMPITAGENDVPDEVSKFADDQMEKHVTKLGRRIGAANRSAKVEADAKKKVTIYSFDYSFSYGTFGCRISVTEKKGKLGVTEKPNCYEHEMP